MFMFMRDIGPWWGFVGTTFGFGIGIIHFIKVSKTGKCFLFYVLEEIM